MAFVEKLIEFLSPSRKKETVDIYKLPEKDMIHPSTRQPNQREDEGVPAKPEEKNTNIENSDEIYNENGEGMLFRPQIIEYKLKSSSSYLGSESSHHEEKKVLYQGTFARKRRRNLDDPFNDNPFFSNNGNNNNNGQFELFSPLLKKNRNGFGNGENTKVNESFHEDDNIIKKESGSGKEDGNDTTDEHNEKSQGNETEDTKNEDFEDDDEDEDDEDEDDEDEDDEDDDIPLNILEDMEYLQKNFKNLDEKYRLIDKIGEGTFSTVYRAEAINGSVKVTKNLWNSPPIKGHINSETNTALTIKQKNPIVALKRIYVTSSPQRIYNELMLLYMLEGCDRVAPLLDIIRHQDQVIAVLPYYKHSDFRDFYRDLPLDGIKLYMYELFSAINFVHCRGIIHRDIKPTNFLYDPFKRKGVLVDFGLAEQVQEPSSNCPCITGLKNSEINMTAPRGYPKEDSRPGRRANRAGTRGFRAPEVLFKCANQSTKIDIWSIGVILLSLLTKRFPFFNSPDDIDALVELTSIFGMKNFKKCAELHGLGLESSISTSNGFSFEQIIYWTINTEKKHSTVPEDSPALETLKVLDSNGNYTDDTELGKSYKDAIALLNACFTLDPKKRVSASEAIKFDFFKEIREISDDVILD